MNINHKVATLLLNANYDYADIYPRAKKVIRFKNKRLNLKWSSAQIAQQTSLYTQSIIDNPNKREQFENLARMLNKGEE